MTDQDPGASSEVGTFFEDPEASNAMVLAAQQIAAPLVQGATMTTEETLMGGGLRVVYFILDASPSMEDVADALRNGFNNDFVPAVKGAREDDISALRIGGVAFSSGDPTPIWLGSNGDYFHSLDQLPELMLADYDPGRGWGTALHRAILAGSARALRFAGDEQARTGMDVDVDIIILSDGGNNAAPHDPREARQVIVGRDRTRVRYLYFFFETDGGHEDPRNYAIHDLGIDPEQVQVFKRKPGETREEQAKRFRRLLDVMSLVSAARANSAVVATAAVLEDDELI